jgi:NADPH-dependent glutamate synthase beta subunit-like oxidoreductase/Pyruvate/2-oxoacid:ferredoxin oxidoreductase delta subunit
MAKVVKKKKKGLAGGALARSSVGRVTSNLRPRPVTKLPPCMEGCPQGTNIRSVLTTIAFGDKYGRSLEESYDMAWNIITEKNPLPAVCGRVCPHPCEINCNRKDKDEPIAINNVERFIGDFGITKNLSHKTVEKKYSEKVAVVGAGPAGLSCAFHLAKLGYAVTIFEAFSKPGGMLRYGIPAYRLPRDILDAEIQKILDMGVELKTSCSIGNDKSLDDLRKEYKAIFISIGAHKGLNLRVDGEDAEGVYSGVDFLNRINSGEKIDLGKSVVVVGGGDTAIDAARISLRLGAKVTILYRRTRKEMPAIEEEIDEALNEGIDIQYLAAPTEIIKDANRIKGIKAIRMELGEPDDSGRRRPVPIEGSDFEIDLDTLIPAISQEPDFDGLESLKAGPKDWIKTNEKQHVQENIYAGGDVLNLGLVTHALAHGREAALAIHRDFRGEPDPVVVEMAEIKSDKMRLDHYETLPRHEELHLPIEERFGSLEIEVACTFTEEDLIGETKRCMSCGYCFDCGKCWEFCQDNAVVKGEKGDLYTYKDNLCTGCKKCAEECPCGFLDMV